MKMITVAEFAKRCNCTPQYIRRMIAENRISGAQKIGFMWVLPENSFITK